jgi:hypothetical protein
VPQLLQVVPPGGRVLLVICPQFVKNAFNNIFTRDNGLELGRPCKISCLCFTTLVENTEKAFVNFGHALQGYRQFFDDQFANNPPQPGDLRHPHIKLLGIANTSTTITANVMAERFRTLGSASGFQTVAEPPQSSTRALTRYTPGNNPAHYLINTNRPLLEQLQSVVQLQRKLIVYINASHADVAAMLGQLVPLERDRVFWLSQSTMIPVQRLLLR